jgi:hypothetical protein
MNKFLLRILELVQSGDVRISEHGYDELAQDGLLVREIIKGLHEARIVDEYPDYPKGPCILLLQNDDGGKPVHVVWGIPRDAVSPAVLVTAYRPDVALWTDDWMRRKRDE